MLKGIHIFCLKIFEIFWDVEMKNGSFGKIKINTRHKTGAYFETQLWIYYIYIISQYKIQRMKFVMGYSTLETIKKYIDKF